MNIRPRSIPKFQVGGRPFYIQPESWRLTDQDKAYYQNQVGGLTNGTISNSGLTLDSNRNNIYFNGDWNNYHNWHSQNIVLPWLNKTNPVTAKGTDWENLILNTLNSWNDAGGFQWLNATPEQRQHGMQSNQTKVHQDTYYNNPLLKEEDNIIGQNTSSYVIPPKANSADRFINGVRVGNNGQVSDTDFGIQTGNRRPTIHIGTDQQTTQQWDNYYKNLGFVGKYKYLDHWVPTRDPSRAEIQFNDSPKLVPDFKPNIPDTINFQPKEKKLNKIKTTHQDNYGFDWGKLREGAQRLFSNPDLWATARLAGNLINNDRVYGEQLKGIKPVLRQSYHTYRQVVGDEATKQAFYRRAAQGQTKAARPFTSDADRQMAYQMEAKRIGDDLRAQGDLADNQEIRRTSDESNQHQWTNTQRDTEVANANLASINQANAAKHLLLAQKHSAQWSSIDNYLKGIEYRKRQKQAEEQALNDQIYTLTRAGEIENDKELLDLKSQFEAASKKPENQKDSFGQKIVNYDAEEIKNLISQIKERQRQLQIETLKNRPRYNSFSLNYKSGGKVKVTYKKKNDSLYKSAKDVVEHFRKMSKMSSDANNRETPKIERLTSHPKGKTKKYQYGGVAPFTVYTPVALGGETSSQTTVSTSSSKSSKDTDGLDLIKELFKSLQLEGLPSDVSGIFQAMNSLMSRKAAFGEELSTGDIASMYIQQMQQINNIKFNKAQFDLAQKTVNEKNAGSELALDQFGRLAVQDKEGKIKYRKYEELKEDDRPLRNDDLLALRSTVESYAFDNNMLQVASNATSMSEIAKFLKEQLPKIESSETLIEGYTKKDSNLIKEGLRVLQEAPEGDYKYSETIKNNGQQIKMALGYLQKILPNNMKNLLKLNAKLEDSSMEEILADLVGAQATNVHKYELNAVTGKAASKDENDGDKNMLPSVAFFNGLGEKDSFIIQDKTNDGLKINVISTPITSKGYNTGSITFDKLESSDFGGQLLINQATMGDSLISSTGRNNIIIDGRIYQTELPIDQEAKRTTGVIKPDLRFLKKIEAADAKLRQMGIDKSDPKNIVTVNKIYQENNLPILYTISNNKPTITSEYARFAIVNGIGTEDAFGDNPQFNDAIKEVSSDKERQQFETMMQQQGGNSKYKLDNGYGIGPISWGETKLYKGTIYIPMVTSNISALAGTGFKAKGEEYNEIEARQQAADAAREMGFTPAGNTLK